MGGTSDRGRRTGVGLCRWSIVSLSLSTRKHTYYECRWIQQNFTQRTMTIHPVGLDCRWQAPQGLVGMWGKGAFLAVTMF